MPGLRQPEVAPAADPATPEPASPTPRSATREAQRRIALFVLVLLLAGAAAWGAGRLLSLGLDAGAPVDPHQHHLTGQPG